MAAQRHAEQGREACGTPAALGSIAAACAQLVGEPDDAQIVRLVLERVAEILGAGEVRLGLLDRDPEWLVVRRAVGGTATDLATGAPITEGVLGHVVRTGAPCLIPDFGLRPLAATEHDGTRPGSVVAVPLRFKGELLGAVEAARTPKEPAFTTDDQWALHVLADVAAARLGAIHQVALQARARELAVLDPAWRPPPEQAGDFVLVVKNHRQVIDADEAACRILGYPREALLQRTMLDLLVMPVGAGEARALGPMRAQVVRGKPVTFDSILRRRDGSLIPVRVHLQAIPAPEGLVVRGVIRELSAEKRAQVEALHAEKMQLLREIGSALAHQLNTPLAIVQGNVELLLADTGDPRLRDLLEPVRAAAERIATAVRTVHGFARPAPPDSASLAVDLSALALETVERMRSLWEAAPQAAERRICLQLETESVDATPGHPVELREALRELLLNAAQALPHGGEIVVRTGQVGGEVWVSVCDNGVGMSEEVRRRCTDPFFTTRRPRATGLGLNRVYHTVMLHRGHLRVESTEGQGTCVTITLPATPGHGPARSDP